MALPAASLTAPAGSATVTSPATPAAGSMVASYRAPAPATPVARPPLTTRSAAVRPDTSSLNAGLTANAPPAGPPVGLSITTVGGI